MSPSMKRLGPISYRGIVPSRKQVQQPKLQLLSGTFGPPVACQHAMSHACNFMT